jgi:hypothetical protein
MHELVQAASGLHDRVAGAQVEVVGIAEDDLRLHIVAQMGLLHGLDRADRAYRHENGGMDRTMVGFDLACTGAAARICLLQRKFHSAAKLGRAGVASKKGGPEPPTLRPSASSAVHIQSSKMATVKQSVLVQDGPIFIIFVVH